MIQSYPAASWKRSYGRVISENENERGLSAKAGADSPRCSGSSHQFHLRAQTPNHAREAESGRQAFLVPEACFGRQRVATTRSSSWEPQQCGRRQKRTRDRGVESPSAVQADLIQTTKGLTGEGTHSHLDYSLPSSRTSPMADIAGIADLAGLAGFAGIAIGPLAMRRISCLDLRGINKRCGALCFY